MEHGKSIRTEETGGARGVDDTTELLLAEDGPGGLGDLVGAPQVDVHDRLPEVIIHVSEGFVTKDASIVDNDVEATKCLDGGLDNLLTILAALATFILTIRPQ